MSYVCSMFLAWAGLKTVNMSAMLNAISERTDTMGHMTHGERRRKGTRRKAEFLVGMASLFDLRGQRTYESMRHLMPDAPPTNVHHTYRVAARSLTPPCSRS